MLTERSEEIKTQVYFCPQCRARKEREVARLRVKEGVAEPDVLKKAA